jgi:hypothetical protein
MPTDTHKPAVIKKVQTLIGQTFSDLTLVQVHTLIPAYLKTKLICGRFRCSCGKELDYPVTKVVNGRKKSCGCKAAFVLKYRHLRSNHPNDMIGKTYGSLLVLRIAGTGNNGSCTFRCQCKCGKELTCKRFNLINGRTTNCGCETALRISRSKQPDPKHRAFRVVLSNYKCTARRRGLEWHLTDEQARQIMARPCVYCKTLPENVAKSGQSRFVYSGIDRIENDKHYTETNTVPACARCNRAKFTMSVQEFRTYIKVLYEHFVKPYE